SAPTRSEPGQPGSHIARDAPEHTAPGRPVWPTRSYLTVGGTRPLPRPGPTFGADPPRPIWPVPDGPTPGRPPAAPPRPPPASPGVGAAPAAYASRHGTPRAAPSSRAAAATVPRAPASRVPAAASTTASYPAGATSSSRRRSAASSGAGTTPPTGPSTSLTRTGRSIPAAAAAASTCGRSTRPWYAQVNSSGTTTARACPPAANSASTSPGRGPAWSRYAVRTSSPGRAAATARPSARVVAAARGSALPWATSITPVLMRYAGRTRSCRTAATGRPAGPPRPGSAG